MVVLTSADRRAGSLLRHGNTAVCCMLGDDSWQYCVLRVAGTVCSRLGNNRETGSWLMHVDNIVCCVLQELCAVVLEVTGKLAVDWCMLTILCVAGTVCSCLGSDRETGSWLMYVDNIVCCRNCVQFSWRWWGNWQLTDVCWQFCVLCVAVTMFGRLTSDS